MNTKALKEQLNTDQIIELWVDIDGYDGDYQISNFGRVKSKKNNTEKILNNNIDGRGYVFVILCKNGIKKTYRVHRLVGIYFIPNPHNYPCLNHKNENKTNNHISNLEWCTYKYNANYGTKTERLKDSLKKSTKNKKQIVQYDMKGNIINKHNGLREASRITNTQNSSISACCKGKHMTANGYVWRYEGDDFDKFPYKSTQEVTVYQYDKYWNFIAKFDSITQASIATGCDNSCITRCCKGTQKTSLGYRWSYDRHNKT